MLDFVQARVLQDFFEGQSITSNRLVSTPILIPRLFDREVNVVIKDITTTCAKARNEELRLCHLRCRIIHGKCCQKLWDLE
jgi:hypothetical protein